MSEHQHTETITENLYPQRGPQSELLVMGEVPAHGLTLDLSRSPEEFANSEEVAKELGIRNGRVVAHVDVFGNRLNGQGVVKKEQYALIQSEKRDETPVTTIIDDEGHRLKLEPGKTTLIGNSGLEVTLLEELQQAHIVPGSPDAPVKIIGYAPKDRPFDASPLIR